ncbi:unnamed protein product [Schistosoma guineensis]|nr:unnamed protein product [Schistosoma guineensis]
MPFFKNLIRPRTWITDKFLRECHIYPKKSSIWSILLHSDVLAKLSQIKNNDEIINTTVLHFCSGLNLLVLHFIFYSQRYLSCLFVYIRCKHYYLLHII